MITLTDIDVIKLLRKNNLNADTLQENVVAKLREKGVRLATAESCTGGLLSERITAFQTKRCLCLEQFRLKRQCRWQRVQGKFRARI